jgi:hypothetical protein
VQGSFTRYLHHPVDSSSLASNVVLSLCVDPISRDTLWVGTNGGLARFDQRTRRLANLRHDPSYSSIFSFQALHHPSACAIAMFLQFMKTVPGVYGLAPLPAPRLVTLKVYDTK